MNEEPKSIWKKSWKGPRAFLFWLLIVFVAALFVAVTITSMIDRHGGWESFVESVLTAMVIFIVMTAVAFAFYKFIRWLCCWRNFKRFLFGLACFITLIALFYAEEDWRGWHAWNKFKHEWEAKGERFDFASVVPPPVPDEQNFAMTPIVFTSYGNLLTRNGKGIPYKDRDPNFVERIKMSITHDSSTPTNCAGNRVKGKFTNLAGWQSYYRDLAAKTNEFPVPAQPQSPAADVLLALSKYNSAVEELRQASQLPCSRFPLNYDTECPATILLPHLSVLKGCSQVLQLRSIAELQNNQPEKALADVKLALQLTDKIRNEPFLISHLVRIALLQIMFQPIWEGLAEHKWSDEQLVALAAELANQDFLVDYQVGMRGEMVLCQIGDIEFMRRHPQNMSSFYDDGNDRSQPSLTEYLGHLIPDGWFYQNEFRCSRFMVQQYLPLADLEHRVISPASLRHADAAFDLEFRHASPYNRLEVMFLPSLGGAVRKFAYAQESVDLARVAIALERYRLAHGAYPESLDALSPQFIAKLPHDVINGQPLHYRRTSDGQFILYSVGWNEKDDGGEVAFKQDGSVDISTGDWVWRYPSKN
jgi:hypothetical protein